MVFQLATIKKNGYFLDDGEKRHEENPQTFKIPTRQERENLDFQDFAKLIFVGRKFVEKNGKKVEERICERMWVSYDEYIDGFYKGRLQNVPYHPEICIKHDNIVYYKPEHIINIDRPKSDTGEENDKGSV